MIPVPTLAQLAAFSGRPETSYSGYAESALLQATLYFSIYTELTPSDYSALDPDSQLLAQQGITAMSDWIYLRQPYQAAIASPLQGETIGSYTYSKPFQVEMRNLQAQELGVSSTGIILWDLAIQVLAKRQKINGVYFGQIRGFDREGPDERYSVTAIRRDTRTGETVLLGPEDFDRVDAPFSINAESFPMDPS